MNQPEISKPSRRGVASVSCPGCGTKDLAPLRGRVGSAGWWAVEDPGDPAALVFRRARPPGFTIAVRRSRWCRNCDVTILVLTDPDARSSESVDAAARGSAASSEPPREPS